MMAEKLEIRRAVRFALLMGAAASTTLATHTALAQDRDADAASSSLETVTVTGSRIKRQDYEASSPVVTIGADVFSQAGTQQIEQVLNELPQLVPSITTTSNNPSNGGQANVNLRGLGTGRTLVLLDGLRLTPSNATGVVDLNTIPTGLIESVEILTGGSSSVYGSDAIAGVVNVRTKRNFEGVQLTVKNGVTAENDGRTQVFELLVGGNFNDDKGNAVISVTFDERDELLAGERAFSSVQFGPNFRPQGSTTTPQGYIAWAQTNAPTQAAYDALFGPGIPNSSAVGFNADGSLFSYTPVRNYRGDTSDPGYNPASFTYNFAPVNYLQLPLERKQLAGFLRHDLGEKAELYGRIMYTTYEAPQQLAPTPVASGIGVTVPATNPLIPAQLRTLLNSRPTPDASFTWERRYNEAGPRKQLNTWDTSQAQLGVRGDINLMSKEWRWDISASYGEVRGLQIQDGNLSRSRLQSALNNPTALASRGCASFNPFGTLSAACGAAIAIRTTNSLEFSQSQVLAYATGDVIDLPAGPLATSVGFEYRRDTGTFRPDEFLRSGDVVGFNANQPIQGEINVREYFTELAVPLLRDLPAVDSLSLDLGYRYSSYNLAGGIDTYKAGLEWKPIDTVKVRGSYNRATRAPSIQELFQPVQEGFPSFQDPCWNGSAQRTGPNAAQVNALCAAQGAPANFPIGNAQVRALTGGNVNLDPESADTYTFGVTWQPVLETHQLRASVDYFRYRLTDTIGTVGASSIISRCFNDLNANPTYSNTNLWCSLFRREASGRATDVFAVNNNLGKRNVDGIDFQVDWVVPLSEFGLPETAGRLSVNFLATQLLKWEFQEDPAAPLVPVKGTITTNLGETYPELKARLGLTWAVRDWRFGWDARFVDGMQVVNNDARRTPTNTGVSPTSPSFSLAPTTGSYFNHRATVNWKPTEWVNLLLGIDNVFDKDPVLYATNSRAGVQANTDPSTYDVLGRRFFLDVRFTF
jgi:outer membrane receptor protein involved in Fe transport